MVMPAIRRHWTTEDVRALINEESAWPRYELIGGELLVTPAPATPHQLAVGEILIRLYAYVSAQALGVAFVSPADLELRPGTIAQPDVFVVPNGGVSPGEGVIQWRDVEKLLLAVEVISPSSVRTDRVEKRDYYLDSGVPDYLVIDVDGRMFEHWSDTRDTPLALLDTWRWHPPGATEPLTIRLPEFFDMVATKAGMLRRRVH